MELAQRPPHPALAAHVRNLAGWHERSDGPVRRRELPGGRVVLVVSLGPSTDIDGRRFGSFLAGVHDAPVLTEHAGESRGVQAYLTPLGARRVFGMPMGELAGRIMELDAAGALAERLHEAPGWPERLALLERWIARRVMDAPPLPAELEWAWRRLLETNGAVPVGALVEGTGWSRRRLAARFRSEIGVPPKALARILRFERAAARLRAPGGAPDLGRLALDCGYYDQAHFNRDFRAFAGTTPSAYRVTSVQAIEPAAA